MDQQIRHSVAARQYRLATFLVVIGALSLGVLLLSRFTELYFESIFFYYGLGATQQPQQHELGGLSLTIGQLVVAGLALVGSVTFVASERRRLARLDRHRCECAASERVVGVSRLTRDQRAVTLVKRSALFSGVLLASWLAQTGYEGYVSGYGWAPLDYYYSPMAIMPLLTVALTCLLLGGLVALTSMFGLRAIVALQIAFSRVRARGRGRVTVARIGAVERVRALRELFGYEIFSRPPPAALPAV